jgi:pSer/pThr/pTyr-binding forkhead associated (FHA) protein
VSVNVLLLILRVAGALLLYIFLLGVLAVIWRDWRAVANQAEQSRASTSRSLGQLVVVAAGKTDLLPGHAFPLNVVTGLGRALSNTIVIEDAFASSEHALLALRDGRWWLEDLGSRNGTQLNGERLSAPAIVATGDEIGIGGVRLRIELADA